MNTLKNSKAMWVLCLVALGLTTGTGCDLQGTDSQATLEAAMNPSATMARFASPVIWTRAELAGADSRLVNPVIDSRPEKPDADLSRLVSPIAEARPEPGESVGISLLR